MPHQISFAQRLILGMVPLSAIALHTAPGLAQSSIPEATEICAFDPNLGVPNVLGMRSFITAAQVGSDSVFVYEQFSSPVLNENDRNILSDVQNTRTVTIYGQPVAEARQILVDSPNSYAALVGFEGEPDKDFGFKAVNDTLVCQEVTGNTAIAPMPEAPTPPATPTPTAPPTPAPAAPQTTFADLPNGNYRLASATYPLGVVSDEELLENGGTLFLFRKFGEDVTGRFSYIDSDLGACVAGTIEGNTVTGQAYTDDDELYEEESTTIFLGPGGYLQLRGNDGGAPRTGARSYNNAMLNLATFSRINAGSVLPTESCP